MNFYRKFVVPQADDHVEARTLILLKRRATAVNKRRFPAIGDVALVFTGILKVPTEPLDSIVNLITDRRIKVAVPLLVAIDGAGGAGKSSLAKRIQNELTDVSIIEMDDFYCPAEASVRCTWSPEEGYQKFFDWIRLRDHALEPVRNGIAPRFQTYDWMRNQLNGWKQVAINPVIVVEGVYALRPELRPFYNLSLFIQTPDDVRFAHLRARGDSEQDIQMWQAAENWYLTNIRPQDDCDLLVEGRQKVSP